MSVTPQKAKHNQRYAGVKSNDPIYPIKTFYPLVGSITDYPRTLASILSFVQSNRPTISATVAWLMDSYHASHDFCRHIVQLLSRVGLVSHSAKKLTPTDIATHYLATSDPEIVVKLLMERVLGFTETLNVLAVEQPIDRITLYAHWKEHIGIEIWRGQFDHRLSWLRGFGYAGMVARSYYLTDRGLRLVGDSKQQTASTTEGKLEISHHDLEEHMRLIGSFFEFETSVRPSVNDVLPDYALAGC